ncbi:MAG: HigA family addiction module antitoxin [Proteobacteria bacterium]|nr:HigA family addiction module antitoxin [Pseudomonadota bacterium]
MSIRMQDIAATDLSDSVARPRKRLVNKHPGWFLLTEFMEPHALSANALATALHVPANRIGAIIKGQRAISADTALRLGHYFGTTAEFWLNLQKDHELRAARSASETEITSSIEPLAA